MKHLRRAFSAVTSFCLASFSCPSRCCTSARSCTRARAHTHVHMSMCVPYTRAEHSVRSHTHTQTQDIDSRHPRIRHVYGIQGRQTLARWASVAFLVSSRRLFSVCCLHSRSICSSICHTFKNVNVLVHLLCKGTRGSSFQNFRCL